MAKKIVYKHVGKIMKFSELPTGCEFVSVNIEPVNEGYESLKSSDERWIRTGWDIVNGRQGIPMDKNAYVIRVVKVEKSDDPFENFRLNGGHIVD